MSRMGLTNRAKSILCPIHKIRTRPTVNMDVNKSRGQKVALEIDNFRGKGGKGGIFVKQGFDLPVLYKNRSIFPESVFEDNQGVSEKILGHCG